MTLMKTLLICDEENELQCALRNKLFHEEHVDMLLGASRKRKSD